MKEITKTWLAGFISQMFVIYALKLIENPWLQIIAALIINIVAVIIFVFWKLKK